MKITALRITDLKYDSGETIIAFFDLEHAGIQLVECCLIRGARANALIAKPPRMETHRGRRGARFIDPEIAAAVTATASQAYKALAQDA